ncbi:MAG: RidA family protein [Fimbriimonadaceae bacterium]
MKTIQPDSLPTPGGHYSPAIVHNGTVYVSGQLPLTDGKPNSDNITDQTNLCLQNLKTILESAGSGKSQVLKLNIFISNIEHWGAVNDCCRAFFGDHKPARAIITSGPLHNGCLIEIDCIAAQLP